MLDSIFFIVEKIRHGNNNMNITNNNGKKTIILQQECNLLR